ncbi:MAG TPA: heme lyase CcmF/NrfE family subunit [Steroidobacteraceae bacterium]|jgi:cytochrome c-type biogenesis protein CcmF|nr:heme lyase CcmF/NrfE family subunit [Steroidobacteraceae bacterium]
MAPELGIFSLILAFVLSLSQAFFSLTGAWKAKPVWMAVARPAVTGQFVFVVMAFACLVYSFVNNDFSVLYVARNSNSQLPLFYKVAAVWGAHEGSLLLWILILSIWSVAVAAFSRQLPLSFSSRVLGVMGLVSSGFMLFTLWTSNPFQRLIPAAADGADLNPVLQDFALAIHPPMLYTGYVGFSVAFAFAIAAMLEGRLDQTWAKWTRPWTIFAWLFQTIGIALGSWWAYYELGWGGWWFWDPVENASFMPWLVGTALIHSLSVTEKRGIFKSWTLLLAIFAFSLSLVGTFLVRSGVLVSVHSFATDPTRGLYILAFLVLTIGGSLTLYAWRAPKLYAPGGFELFSREFFLLVNNVALVSVAGLVLWGTLSPLVYEVLGIGKISVGPPVFAVMFLVPVLPLMVFMAFGMHSVWRRGKLSAAAKPLWLLLALAVVLAISIQGLVFREFHWLGLIGFTFGFWVIFSSLLEPVRRWRQRQTVTAALMGMCIAHFGVGMFAIGASGVESYKIEKDVALKPGGDFLIAGYKFRFVNAVNVRGPNYDAVEALVEVTRGGRPVAILKPQKRHFWVQQTDNSQAAISVNWARDLFVAMGNPLGESAWSMRIQYKPLVRYIWLGALVMAIGGFVAATDRRYRVRATVATSDRAAAPPNAEPKPGVA